MAWCVCGRGAAVYSAAMARKTAPQATPDETMTTATMLARLVAFDTTSCNSNLALVDFVRAWLDRHGVPYRICTNAAGDKANIHAIIGPNSAGGIALSGHVDTVPVEGQTWSADPFTTVHVGTILGGATLNIIPERCEFTMEWRTIPNDDFFAQVERLRAHVTAAIEPAMSAVDGNCGFTLEVMNWIPGLRLPGEHALADLVKQVTGANATGYVSYGTEGGLYEQAGIPTIVCGPGAIAQAHQPDEWIAQSQLDACDAFIRRLADRLAG